MIPLPDSCIVYRSTHPIQCIFRFNPNKFYYILYLLDLITPPEIKIYMNGVEVGTKVTGHLVSYRVWNPGTHVFSIYYDPKDTRWKRYKNRSFILYDISPEEFRVWGGEDKRC